MELVVSMIVILVSGAVGQAWIGKREQKKREGEI